MQHLYWQGHHYAIDGDDWYALERTKRPEGLRRIPQESMMPPVVAIRRDQLIGVVVTAALVLALAATIAITGAAA